jgi:hypothetical protein
MTNIVTSAAERARFVGEWQMDMVGTPYAPAKLWALTPDGRSNFVVDEAYKASARFGFTGLQNCKLGQSDHQAFFDVGIPSALFIWLDYHAPVAPNTCTSPGNGQYTTEPEYHRPADGMNNISPERLQTTLDVIGGAFAHNAMNRVDVTSNKANTAVKADCGDGVRSMGTTDATGALPDLRFPHASCTIAVGGSSKTVAIAGDTPVAFAAADATAGGAVPATLSLTLGAPATFGAFLPGVDKPYTASTTAKVISTAGDAALTVSDPGHLTNGAFSLPEALQVQIAPASWTLPVSNANVDITFKQHIGANDALRTGSYSKTLTFSLSTTTP